MPTARNVITPLMRFAATLALFTVIPSTLGAAPPPNADDIFARARASLASAVYPRSVSYVIAVTVSEQGVVKTRHYDALYDAERDRVQTHVLAHEDRDATPAPGSKLFGAIVSHGHPIARQMNATVTDFLGVPFLAPNYAFGLVRPQTAPVALAPDGAPSLPQIGRVVTATARYRVALAGTEVAAGHRAYHLTLVPLRDPERNRLRDLWADTQTYDIVALRSDGNFTAPQTEAVPWTMTFANAGGGWYIASETADAPVVYSRSRRYDAVSIRFESIAPAPMPFIDLLSGGSAVTKLIEP